MSQMVIEHVKIKINIAKLTGCYVSLARTSSRNVAK